MPGLVSGSAGVHVGVDGDSGGVDTSSCHHCGPAAPCSGTGMSDIGTMGGSLNHNHHQVRFSHSRVLGKDGVHPMRNSTPPHDIHKTITYTCYKHNIYATAVIICGCKFIPSIASFNPILNMFSSTPNL